MKWFGRSSAPPPAKAPTTLSEHRKNGESVPEGGSQLQQLAGRSKISAQIGRILGLFNPRRVRLDDFFLMMRHSTVAFGLAILRGVLMNMVWSIESDDTVIKDTVDKILRPKFRSLARAMSLAIFIGFAHAEIVWSGRRLTVDTEEIAKDGTKKSIEKVFDLAWVIDRFKNISPKTTSFILDPVEDEWIGIEQRITKGMNRSAKGTGPADAPPQQGTGANGDVKPDPGTVFVPREKVVLWSYRKEDVYGELTGFGVGEQAYMDWWSSMVMGFSADRYFERRAEGNYLARAGREINIGGQVLDGFQWMADQILGWRNGGVLTLNNERLKQSKDFAFDVKLLEGDKRGEMFQDRLDALDIRILRALFITDKAGTSGDSTGSFAQAKVHADTMAQMLAAIESEFVEEVANPQVVDRIVLFLFGQEALDNSNTRLVEAGMGKDQRDALIRFGEKLLEAEAMVEGGETIKFSDLISQVDLAKMIGLPIKTKEERDALMKAKVEARKQMEEKFNPPGIEEPDDEGKTEPDAVKDDLIGKGVLDEEDK